MLKKVILQTQFGSPHPWTQEYFKNFEMLGQYGWELIVFTQNQYSHTPYNVKIIPMGIQEFDELVQKYCGVNPNNYSDTNGNPHKLVSDYYPAYGQIFQDYIKDAHYWGHTNWDMVYGRLDKFLSDVELAKYDIWTDEINAINGIFCLYKNNEYVNNLFREVPGWEQMFTDHGLFHFDEERFTDTIRELTRDNKVKLGYPLPYPFYSYDRLPQHQDGVNLVRGLDGSLYEQFTDFITKQNVVGREIMSFHFSYTKEYPHVSKL